MDEKIGSVLGKRKRLVIADPAKRVMDREFRRLLLLHKINVVVVVVGILGFISLLWGAFRLGEFDFHLIFLFFITSLLLIIASKMGGE